LWSITALYVPPGIMARPTARTQPTPRSARPSANGSSTWAPRTSPTRIGYDGMTGVAVLHGSKRAACDIVMQIAGNGWSIDARIFRQLLTESATLAAPLQLYAHVLSLQGAHTALANCCGTIEERLARWLLMAADRLEADLEFTHDILGRMLGVQRPGITVAMRALKDRGGISTGRGRVAVRDRIRLEKSANGFYGRPEAEFKRLLH
jgi:hypothetical protein